MTKKIVIYVIISILLLCIAYYIHTTTFTHFANKAPIPLEKVYAFFVGFYIILGVSFSFLYTKTSFKDQLGFLYLASVVLKIILFSIIFSKQLFMIDSSFPRQSAVNLLIPIILTLIAEVFIISKLLNNSTRQKNAK